MRASATVPGREYIAALGEKARASRDEMGELSTSDRYKLRKSAYRPGSVILVPMASALGGIDGTYGVAVVESCNWLGNIGLYFLACWFDEKPDQEMIKEWVVPEAVAQLFSTGDTLIMSGDFPVVGAIAGFDVQEWPIAVLMWSTESRGPVVARMRPRKLMRSNVDSPEVAGFVTGEVPMPWIENQNRTLNAVPAIQLSELQPGPGISR